MRTKALVKFKAVVAGSSTEVIEVDGYAQLVAREHVFALASSTGDLLHIWSPDVVASVQLITEE